MHQEPDRHSRPYVSHRRRTLTALGPRGPTTGHVASSPIDCGRNVRHTFARPNPCQGFRFDEDCYPCAPTNPGFTAVIMLTLGISAAANLAISASSTHARQGGTVRVRADSCCLGAIFHPYEPGILRSPLGPNRSAAFQSRPRDVEHIGAFEEVRSSTWATASTFGRHPRGLPDSSVRLLRPRCLGRVYDTEEDPLVTITWSFLATACGNAGSMETATSSDVSSTSMANRYTVLASCEGFAFPHPVRTAREF